MMIKLKDLTKKYGDFEAVNNLTLSVQKGEVFGFIGPNGAGKTTFLRMMVGQEQPDKGSIELGETVELAYVDQSREDLVADLRASTPTDAGKRIGKARGQVRAALEAAPTPAVGSIRVARHAAPGYLRFPVLDRGDGVDSFDDRPDPLAAAAARGRPLE